MVKTLKVSHHEDSHSPWCLHSSSTASSIQSQEPKSEDPDYRLPPFGLCVFFFTCSFTSLSSLALSSLIYSCSISIYHVSIFYLLLAYLYNFATLSLIYFSFTPITHNPHPIFNNPFGSQTSNNSNAPSCFMTVVTNTNANDMTTMDSTASPISVGYGESVPCGLTVGQSTAGTQERIASISFANFDVPKLGVIISHFLLVISIILYYCYLILTYRIIALNSPIIPNFISVFMTNLKCVI